MCVALVPVERVSRELHMIVGHCGLWAAYVHCRLLLLSKCIENVCFESKYRNLKCVRSGLETTEIEKKSAPAAGFLGAPPPDPQD